MKSLSFSTATFAVAISLASTAHANEPALLALPEIAEEAPDAEPAASGAYNVEVPSGLVADAAVLVPTDALVSLPAPAVAEANFTATNRVVTTRGLEARYGDIDAFYGDIDAFYGDIDAFWGDISPFYGDIDAFWGDIIAFDNGDLAALGKFWQSASAQISTTEANWSSLQYTISNTGYVNITFDGTPNRIRNSFEALIAQAEAQFGEAYRLKTGRSFRDGFVADILARHGIDLANTGNAKRTLAKSAAERAAFYLDWHDSLNQYSGVDAVDHWMATANWTPSITQIQGSGVRTIVGVVDSSFGSEGDLLDNILWKGGSKTKLHGHGAGVASLIFGAHDGEGVMGIAPQARVTAYNPFGLDGSATWNDVALGIWTIKGSAFWDTLKGEPGRASVINLSLGESGWVASQGLADVFKRSDIKLFNGSTVYVIAAGNDGITQSTDIEWGYASANAVGNYFNLWSLSSGTSSVDEDTAAIFVGSVGLTGEVSGFSNRPGTTCLLDNGVCRAGNELMNHFLVAPGEFLLVDDGNGGLVRRSGTSFAAPLVSGAVALLHDRWPWLADAPHETKDIILRSAKDLGAPGVDPVYGHGLLDVAASQSPLDFNALQFYLYSNTASQQVVSATELLNGGVPAWWETNGVYFTAFENIGGTYRDFTIPMSTLQYGTSSNVLGHGWQRMQDFVSDRFANWLLSNGADSDGDGTLGVSQIRSNTGETRGQWTMRYDAIAPRFTQDGAMRPVHNAATLTTPNGQMSFTLGHGQGALALSGGEFGIMSDHDYATGGVNPVLGFASGEVFAGASYKLADATTLSFGYSKDREDYEDLEGASELDRTIQRQLGAREAEAITVGLEQQVAKGFTLGAQWTRLDEKDAILGSQTGVDALLGNGSVTDAVTLTASLDMGDGLSFDLSATGGATDVAGGQLLATSTRALSTAGQFSVNKRGVMGEKDVLRVSVGQPLNIERGELELTSEQVVDRVTGERGLVTQTIGITTKRRNTAEIVYATPVTETSEFGLVTRYISSGTEGDDESFMIGANFGLRF
ncbi:S8 family serine peptidase [Erythrobacter sp. THAF29]|uniref:S8 family serine peptidase n=1 Tax=Erythrobacter sp. THAF29 TaxID=2587851 RepID=UPI001268BF99|nr:S8 family serine peptidase [Erythrobacter sp. THAF29]QFT77914.1 Minor extracellular protease Epr precursor [Erythrobacter sp. THAF29]